MCEGNNILEAETRPRKFPSSPVRICLLFNLQLLLPPPLLCLCSCSTCNLIDARHLILESLHRFQSPFWRLSLQFNSGIYQHGGQLRFSGFQPLRWLIWITIRPLFSPIWPWLSSSCPLPRRLWFHSASHTWKPFPMITVRWIHCIEARKIVPFSDLLHLSHLPYICPCLSSRRWPWCSLLWVTKGCSQ